MVTGFWVSSWQYRMSDARSGKVKVLMVPEAALQDPELRMEPEELEDITLEYRERFGAELRGAPAKKLMPRNTQHDMGRALNEIEASRQHRKESLHGRFW